MTNAFTIDVEDYRNLVGRDLLRRDGPPTDAVVRNTNRLLDILSRNGVRATFFVLGEVAATFPQLVRDIAAAGHELGVHGFYHRQVFRLSPDAFRREVADAKALIEGIAGVAVCGHRAPAFSIMPGTQWALDVLADTGFRYDSSVFPIAGRRYGWPGFPLDIHPMKTPSGGTIIEAPMSSVGLFGRQWPACGGGYLRHYPLAVTRWAIRRVQKSRPAIVYLHPYERDIDAHELDLSALRPSERRKVRLIHWRQMRNRHTVEQKLERLLSEFRFTTLSAVIDLVLGGQLADHDSQEAAE